VRRPGRYYRASERPFDTSLCLWLLTGKERRSGVGGKVRKIREAAPRELGAQALRSDVDRGPSAARERHDQRSARRQQAVELVEERDHVAEPNEVEGRVGVQQLRGVGDLEANPVAQVVVEILACLLDHPLGEIGADNLGFREAASDQERGATGAGPEVEGPLRRRLDALERCFVGRVSVRRRAELVPLRREAIEDDAYRPAKQRPESRLAHDEVGRQAAEPLRQRRVAHGTRSRIRTSWPGAAPKSSAAFPPLIASAMLRYESS